MNYHTLDNTDADEDNILTNLLTQSRLYEFNLFQEFNRRVSTNYEVENGLFI